VGQGSNFGSMFAEDANASSGAAKEHRTSVFQKSKPIVPFGKIKIMSKLDMLPSELEDY
jgi:hypothetical protein